MSAAFLRSPGFAVGAAAALLWTLSGLLYLASASSSYAGRLLSFFGIGITQSTPWQWPGIWAVLAFICSTAVLIAIAVAVIARYAIRGNAFLVMWFSVILASAVLGLGTDVIGVASMVAAAGPGALTIAGVDSAMTGAYWGLVTGWVPALIGVAVQRRSTLSPYSAAEPRTRRSLVVAASAVVALVVVGALGTQAHQAQIIEAEAAAQGLSAEDGAYPDPGVPVEAVPTMAPGAEIPSLDPSWCTPDKAMLLLGTQDAATGHHVQSITVMNFSEEPCLIEGYPDIAFADQNGSALDVTVAQGSSFMATDPGATPVTIPGRGQARAMIGWDANATAGALVARQLYAAQVPGLERGSWPVELDITAGSTVEITAWELDPFAGMQPDQ